jgi:hypothetical protein
MAVERDAHRIVEDLPRRPSDQPHKVRRTSKPVIRASSHTRVKSGEDRAHHACIEGCIQAWTKPGPMSAAKGALVAPRSDASPATARPSEQPIRTSCASMMAHGSKWSYHPSVLSLMRAMAWPRSFSCCALH